MINDGIPVIVHDKTFLRLRTMVHGVCYSKSPMGLKENGGHIDITESWSRSILKRMGFKKICSTSGKLQLPIESHNDLSIKNYFRLIAHH